jgi:hypothetical protein
VQRAVPGDLAAALLAAFLGAISELFTGIFIVFITIQ